ncbi:two-component system response regulator [Nibricoccus aquaticus]|uniref:Two-component system response regulator n=1 Tax=Nibricoccus aquaticus TaxID=2576891 RepID=A0A290Q2V4_9BACT|nr:response regulator [Nibricoccus aquaticus]ATC62743.1 two-component system response regulator [Nibricoccus aquaticus]
MNTPSEVEILLVEDNPRDAELTLRALKKRHLANHLVHVKDGQEALDWLTGMGAYAGRDLKQMPKVVLLDLKLPKMNGLEVLAAIRANEVISMVPVVVLTSSQEQRDVIESYRLRVNSYIVKPVDFEKFSVAVAEAGHYWLLVNHNVS